MSQWIQNAQYGLEILDETQLPKNPFELLEQWLQAAIQQSLPSPNAMCLSTVDSNHSPHSRMVLLQAIQEEKLYFYTNLNSPKSQQMQHNSSISLLFFWAPLERQIRLQGAVIQADSATADAYFATRPRDSQVGSWVSKQSKPLASRATLEAEFKAKEKEFQHTPIKRPPFWGGYAFSPELFEFWQGRNNRLHDRVLYKKNNSAWALQRLYP